MFAATCLSRRKQGQWLLALFLFFFSVPSLSKDYRFVSALDQFTLSLTGDHYFIEDQKADSYEIQRIQMLFRSGNKTKCPDKLPNPQVVVFEEEPESQTRFELFPKENIMRSGGRCQIYRDRELLNFPLHRVWFLGSQKLSIPIRKKIQIIADEYQFHFHFNKLWRSVDDTVFPNTAFLKVFLRELSSFNVVGRWGMDAIKSWHLTVKNEKGRSYQFYELYNGKIGVQFPGKQWLVETTGIHVARNIPQKKWISPFSGDLRVIVNEKAPLSERVRRLRNLKRHGLKEVEIISRSILSDKSSNQVLMMEASDILIKNSTLTNLKALVDSLVSKHSDLVLKKRVIRHLRSIHPAGETISNRANSMEIEKVLRSWKNWWNTYKDQ